MAGPVTLKDIATLLGINPSTVSKALKGHPDIKKETREKVCKLATTLNYQPNPLALSLRNRKSYQIAVIVPEFTNYFFACAIQGIIKVSNNAGYEISVFESLEKYENEKKICNHILHAGYAGVIVSISKTTKNISHFKQLQEGGIVLSFFDRICGDIDTDRVVEDNFKGAYEAVKYMIMTGCKRILHLTGDQHLQIAQKRRMGYVQALLDARLPVEQNLIAMCDKWECAGEVVRAILKRNKFDGIFAINDWTAIGALQEVKKLGLRVPEDIAVCGYGGEPVVQVVEPTLTTICQDGQKLGETITKLLLERINGNPYMETKTHILKTELLIQDSTRKL